MGILELEELVGSLGIQSSVGSAGAAVDIEGDDFDEGAAPLSLSPRLGDNTTMFNTDYLVAAIEAGVVSTPQLAEGRSLGRPEHVLVEDEGQPTTQSRPTLAAAAMAAEVEVPDATAQK